MRTAVIALAMLLLLAGCEAAPEQSPDATPVLTATSSVADILTAPTGTAAPQTPSATTAPVQNGPAEAGATLYADLERNVALRLPSTWQVREGDPVQIGSAPALLENFAVMSDEVVMLLFASRTDEFLNQFSDATSAIELAQAFLNAGRLSSFGRIGEVILPLEPTRINDRDAAIGVLRMTTAAGQPGAVYLTALVGSGEKIVLAALTVAPAGEQILGEIDNVIDSLEVIDRSGRMVQSGRFVAGVGQESLPGFHTVLEADARLLILLETDADSNAILLLRDAEQNTLVEVNQGVKGVPEVLYLVAPYSGLYELAVREAGGAAGSFTLRTIDLRADDESVQLFTERQLTPGAAIEFTFLGSAGEPVVIYVEPVGNNARLMDPVLEILDAETNFYARVDDRYQGEPETILFEPTANGNFMARITDFFGDVGTYRISVARP